MKVRDIIGELGNMTPRVLGMSFACSYVMRPLQTILAYMSDNSATVPHMVRVYHNGEHIGDMVSHELPKLLAMYGFTAKVGDTFTFQEKNHAPARWDYNSYYENFNLTIWNTGGGWVEDNDDYFYPAPIEEGPLGVKVRLGNLPGIMSEVKYAKSDRRGSTSCHRGYQFSKRQARRVSRRASKAHIEEGKVT